MEREGLTPTALARRAGLSRQAVYRLLDPAYDPFPQGFRRVAEVLGRPPELLVRSAVPETATRIEALLRAAAAADPRAFEVLPGALHVAGARDRLAVRPEGDSERRLLAAAAEYAYAVAPDLALRLWIDELASTLPPHLPFFFGARWMDAERIVSATPAPFARHLVFGAFDEGSLRRHFGQP